MKKILLMLTLFIFLLTGCDDNLTENEEDVSKEGEETQHTLNVESNVEIDNEVREFIDNFNSLASLSDLDVIDNVEEKNNDTQVLYASNNYGIVAIFNEYGNIDRYSIPISREQPYDKLEGNGFNAMLYIGEALDLDIDQLAKEFENSLTKESHVYFEDDYSILFFNHKLSGSSDWGIVIEFAVF